MEYRDAVEVKRAATGLIESHHTHLDGVRIQFVFMSETPQSKGKDVWARARKISGLNAFLSSEFGVQEEYAEAETYFVIEVSEEIWDGLNTRQRKALVDHELHHCELHPEKGTPVIVGHDVTEFGDVLKRHGLWNESVKEFVEAGAEQLSLIEDGVLVNQANRLEAVR